MPPKKKTKTEGMGETAAAPPAVEQGPVIIRETRNLVTIGNDASVACGVFLQLARRHVPGDVHPTVDLAQCALHMVWASVDESSPIEVAQRSFQRLSTKGALTLTNRALAPKVSSAYPFRYLSKICHRWTRANVLVRIDTEGLTGVTEIDRDFLRECKSLRAVNLRGLVNVTRIGDSFLCDCESLTAVDLAPLAGVTLVGEWFLAGCRGLKAVDLASLANVTRIGAGFLCDCPALRRLDLSAMSNVVEVDDDFLLDGHRLESLVRPDEGELATVAIDGF
jgi:hypothetical protein